MNFAPSPRSDHPFDKPPKPTSKARSYPKITELLREEIDSIMAAAEDTSGADGGDEGESIVITTSSSFSPPAEEFVRVVEVERGVDDPDMVVE